MFDATLTLTLRDGKPVMDGMLIGTPGEVNAAFTLLPVIGKPEELLVRLTHGSMQWSGGTITINDVDFYPNKNANTPFTVQLQNIPLDDVVKKLLHPQAFATGTFSGELPLIYGPYGISIAGVRVGAVQQGTLRVPAGIIPQSSEEMVLLADVLSNFNYSILQIASGAPDAEGKVPVILTMEGNNPVYGNQPIKLNVNLGGDVLPFVNSALQLSQNPTGMIKNETNVP
jgi:hypothetical protein